MVGGAAPTDDGVGGTKGAFGRALVAVVGGAIFASGMSALIVVETRPGGAGSEVAELADPGRTTGCESLMEGFLSSAYRL